MRYQETASENTLRRLSMCISDLQSVEISDSAVITLYKWSINPIANPNLVCSHSDTLQY
jgi:hypothetical protein